MEYRNRQTWWYASAGIIAAITAMAFAHAVASFLGPHTSPVLAVGTAVIDATPTPVKEWAVRELGFWDKPILLGSVLIGTLAAAATAGVLTRRHRNTGIVLTVGIVALAGAAVLSQPEAQLRDLVPTLVAIVLGPAVLVFFDSRLRNPRSAPDASGPSRRTLLAASALLVVGASAAVAAAEWSARTRARISAIILPKPAKPLPELPLGLENDNPGISAFRTPNKKFYRVDTKLAVPIVDETTWKLTIDGMVDRPLSFTYADLLDMPLVEHDITLTCVSNEVGGNLVGAARWLGVPVADLLEQAGIKPGADQLLSTDVDGFAISTPLSTLVDGRNALIAVGMNGETLPRAHGFPARLVVPGLYGFVGATKWITGMTVSTYAKQSAYWTKRGWATDAPIQISSRIDTPKPLSTIQAGRHAIGGVAWAQHVGIEKVEVRIDGGPWVLAELGPDAGIDYWRQWYLPWDATAGRHHLAVRATGADGVVQTASRATPFPRGSRGVQEIIINVA